jgi:hypothetical protein
VNETQADIGRIIEYFRGRDEVSTLYVFGSAAEGRVTPESDIDVAVLVDEAKLRRRNFEALKKRYYAASPRFSRRPIDIVLMNTASPYLKHRVLKTGKILFDRNRRLRVRFTARAIIEYLDYKPIEEIILGGTSRRFSRTGGRGR